MYLRNVFLYNVVPYQSLKSIAMLPCQANNGVSSFVSEASSSNKTHPNLTESYYSYCSSGVLISESSLRKSEPLMLEPSNYKKPANLMMKTLKYENLESHNIGEENSEISKNKIASDASVDGNKISEILLKTSERVTRKRCASAMDFSLYSSPGVGDRTKPTMIEWIINEGSKENNCGALRVGSSDEKQDISNTVKEDSIRGRHLTPDDVVRVIGQRLFRKARKTMLHQQKIFSLQILELHRLIKVQRLIARSPQKLHEKNFDPNRPLIQNVHLSQKSTPKLLTTSTYIPSTDAKLAPPWFFPPPIGNQWLVPIKSLSEGLIYKPYPGPCFPTNGITLGTELGQCSNAKVERISYEEEPLGKDALTLFPMAPSNEALKDDQNDDRKSRVIKVVPHNRISAPASAAWIFESLKKEREILCLSSCTSHVS